MQKSKSMILALGLLSLVACTDSGSSTSGSLVNSNYRYGNVQLPGNLIDLQADYRPQNLNAKVFTIAGKTNAPMDFKQQNLTITFDAALQKAVGHSVITFNQSVDSNPYFQLKPTVQSAKLDGIPVTTQMISDPDGAGEVFVSLNQSVTAGEHTLEIDYPLDGNSLSFKNSGVAILTDMSDLPDAHYFESWGPTSFEDDSFQLNLELKILNATDGHKLFTNGHVTELAAQDWQINFPNYFTTSSIYFHLTNTPLLSLELTIQGQQRSIPITLYGSDQSLLDQGAQMLPDLFRELENDYGPYSHEKFVAYLHPSGGGMEYSGATITSLGALDHELFHSWFARGVMPAEGRSGWIDEAFASWRDYGYFKSSSLLSRSPTLLANFSPFLQSTPTNCYQDGRRLVAELDQVFADFGGMKPLMKLFFERYNHRVVTNEELWNFLQAKTQKNIDLFFQRYTLAQAVPMTAQALSPLAEPIEKSKHPAALTPAEAQALR